MERVKRVNWTNNAKIALRAIFDFHAANSELSAEIIINEIIDKADSIVFAKQYQVDEINPKYRRMIARQYKILYKVHLDTVFIMNVVSTKDNPEKLKNL